MQASSSSRLTVSQVLHASWYVQHWPGNMALLTYSLQALHINILSPTGHETLQICTPYVQQSGQLYCYCCNIVLNNAAAKRRIGQAGQFS